MKPVAALAPLLDPGGLAQRLRGLREAGVLDSLEVHVVDRLGALVGEADADVLLGLALAVRAPRHGHICVDLAALTDDQLLDEPAEPTPSAAAAETPVPWLPLDREAWLERLGRSPLVRKRSDDDRAKPFVLDGSLLYTDRYFTYQQGLARALRARFEALQKPVDAALLARGIEDLIQPMPEPDGAPFAGLERQKLGAAMALLRGLTVISGGPGTGKTYTVRSVLTLLWAQWALAHDPAGETPGPRVALAAPTGKAAARMREAMQLDVEEFLAAAAQVLPPARTVAELRTFLNALQPSTIHRLLRWTPATPTRFRHDADHPLPFDVVVIDETSMVDFALMAKLIDAVAATTRVILLGDQHQLSSVEAGTVLADLCGPTSAAHLRLSKAFAAELRELAGMPEVARHVELVADRGPYDAIVQLDRSRRFKAESGIGQFARACLDDAFDPVAAVELLTRFPDVQRIEHGERGALLEPTRQAILLGYLPYLERLRKGPRNGESLAALHQDVLQLFDRFRVLCAHRNGRTGVGGMNRAVMDLLVARGGLSTRGEYFVGRPVMITRNDYVVQLFNGDVGLVVADAQGERSVVFPVPDGVRYVAPARLPDHQTVFAMTIHKSQGSELEHAMVVLPEAPSPILTRELIYTGVTRAQQRMTLVGSAELLVAGLTARVRRASGLEQEVWGKRPAVRAPTLRASGRD
jgi:exodeoxyribonuclease V alpha subunit